jgi:hypothetical protein
MSLTIRRRATQVAALAAALTIPLLGAAPASAATVNVAAGKVAAANVATADKTSVTVALGNAAPVLATAAAAKAAGCDTPIVPCMTADDVVCWEDNWCPISVTVTPYAGLPIRVEYATADGTAMADLNYLPAEGMITIERRSTGGAVPVFVTSSRTPTGEPAYFFVRLFAPSSGVLVNDTATVTIVPRPATA